jgi:hypothetical protein
LPTLNGFQVEGGEYIVPLVYSVCDLGNWVSVDGADEDDPEAPGVVLLGEPPVHALTAVNASTATAAVPYLAVRHRLPVFLDEGLTCSYLLISRPVTTPVRVAVEERKSAG